jgi:ParB/RepB/Spo0J family partition protein
VLFGLPPHHILRKGIFVQPEHLLIDTRAIDVLPGRQREDYGDIGPLMSSIRQIGLLQPIVVMDAGDNFYLLAGGRRLKAVRELGLKSIHAVVWPASTPETMKELIELEENIKRKQLDWKEEAAAAVRLHDMHCSLDESWNVSNTADILSSGGRTMSRLLSVGRAILEENEQVLACTSVAAAAAALSRQTQMAVDDEAAVLLDNVNIEVGDDFEVSITEKDLGDIASSITVPDPDGIPDEEPAGLKSIRSAEHDVFCVDFADFAKDYQGPPFQVIHLDPPYGIMHHKSEQGGGAVHGTYQDTEDDFWRVLQALLAYQKALIAPRCHILLWFSFKYYTRIVDLLDCGDWKVNPYPIIWHKTDNIGLVPDAKRYGRRVYETALLISVGDRQINNVRPNLISVPSGKAKAKHLSEKPQDVMNEILLPLIQEGRNVNFLDPCCGSGTSLSAAELLGAQTVTGLDIDPTCVDTARRTLNTRRLQMVGTAPLQIDEPEEEEDDYDY